MTECSLSLFKQQCRQRCLDRMHRCTVIIFCGVKMANPSRATPSAARCPGCRTRIPAVWPGTSTGLTSLQYSGTFTSMSYPLQSSQALMRSSSVNELHSQLHTLMDADDALPRFNYQCVASPSVCRCIIRSLPSSVCRCRVQLHMVDSQCTIHVQLLVTRD